MRSCNTFGRIYLSDCLSVCLSGLQLLKALTEKLGMRVRLHSIQNKFVYQSHRIKVKVKVTGAIRRVI